MESNKASSGEGGQAAGPAEPKLVSLEEFIIKNWQILTILGVFVGFTNYVHTTENAWLQTLAFLLTFIVELEIMQLLLKIKDKSFLLKVFTLLTAVFIVIFAGYIYSSFFSANVSAVLAKTLPQAQANAVPLAAALVLVAALAAAFALYRPAVGAALGASRQLGPRQLRLVIVLACAILALGVIAEIGIRLAQPQAPVPQQATTTTTVPTTTLAPTTTTLPETTTTLQQTTTTLPEKVACVTNADCGNETMERICYMGDVYLQQSKRLCMHSGTPEANCVLRQNLAGESITQVAKPLEKCNGGCASGICLGSL